MKKFPVAAKPDKKPFHRLPEALEYKLYQRQQQHCDNSRGNHQVKFVVRNGLDEISGECSGIEHKRTPDRGVVNERKIVFLSQGSRVFKRKCVVNAKEWKPGLGNKETTAPNHKKHYFPLE